MQTKMHAKKVAKMVAFTTMKKKRFFRAKNMYEAVIPAYFLTRFAGLTPFLFVFKDGKSGAKFFKPLLIWTLTLIVAFSVFLVRIRETNDSIVSVLNGNSSIQKFGDYLQLATSTLSVYTTFIMTIRRRRSFAVIFHVLSRVEAVFKDLGVSTDFSDVQAKIFLLVSLHSLVTVIIIGAYVCVQFVTDLRPRIEMVFCYYFSNYIMSVFVVQFVVHVLVLTKRFKRLNEYFDAIEITAVPYFHINKFDIAKKITSLCSLHDTLCDLAELINYCFNIQILTIIAISFITIVFNLFYVLEGLSQHVDHRRALFVCFCFQSCFMHFVNILMLSIICGSNHNEGKKSAVHVHKLLNKDLDSVTKKKLLQFSMQLVHRSPRFSAFGLFPLDASLIYTVVGSTTTYLIILVQFASSSNNNKKSN